MTATSAMATSVTTGLKLRLGDAGEGKTGLRHLCPSQAQIRRKPEFRQADHLGSQV